MEVTQSASNDNLIDFKNPENFLQLRLCAVPTGTSKYSQKKRKALILKKTKNKLIKKLFNIL
jgi:hypothetical protein